VIWKVTLLDEQNDEHFSTYDKAVVEGLVKILMR
jgi:hypothetical protein